MSESTGRRTVTDAQDQIGSLSNHQRRVLLLLSEAKQPPPISRVATSLGLSMPRASAIASSLVAKRLVERVYSRVDLRVTLLELTKQGQTVCRQLTDG